LLNRVIGFSLRNRLLVVLVAVGCTAFGVVSMRQLDIDAFPDTTPVQVQVNTVAPALGPEEVETQITAPIEQALGGLPKLQSLRSVSKFGLSQVVLIFEDGTDIYFARQVVNERLGALQLPAGIDRPKMGPVSTGLGEVFHYVVTGKGNPGGLCSAPHGAGRRYSRNEARRRFTADDLAQRMRGIEYRHGDEWIDEIPDAYKDIDVVMADAADLVQIEHELRQILNVKGV